MLLYNVNSITMMINYKKHLCGSITDTRAHPHIFTMT